MGGKMRIAGALLGVLCIVQSVSASAETQPTCPRPDALGVSRVVEIDGSGGPWFGAPHGDRELLAPGEIVLTFDDGPAPHSTRPILAALAAQCTKATFFMVGEMAAEHADVAREVAEQGHTVGTHTWSHLNLKRLTDEKMKVQIEAAFTAVEKAAGVPIAPFFRYPYLSSSDATVDYLKSRNIAQFDIDIDSFDWRNRNATTVIRRVMSTLEQRGRGIILMHDIHPSTAAAVPELLRQLNAKGYKVVHLRPISAVETLAGIEPPIKDIAHGHAVRRVRIHAKSGPPSKWLMW
jgi:peptidoglycan/xylan/chitin deacetylase (PgdA/CDA1 family)